MLSGLFLTNPDGTLVENADVAAGAAIQYDTAASVFLRSVFTLLPLPLAVYPSFACDTRSYFAGPFLLLPITAQLHSDYSIFGAHIVCLCLSICLCPGVALLR